MTALFDLSDYQEPTHACAGSVCQVCQTTKTPQQAKRAGTASVKRDEAWWQEAAQFLRHLVAGDVFTVDDLRLAIGEPEGSGNQFGACIRTWAASDKIIHHGYQPSRIKSNHGHMVRVWCKA